MNLAAFFAIVAPSPQLALLDVGCSGGLDPRRGIYGDGLAALAFDPLRAVVQRTSLL
jgi:hypothetical protein